jgi:regulator of replication initiation timing
MGYKLRTHAEQSVFRFNEGKLEAGGTPSKLENEFNRMPNFPGYDKDSMNINVLYLESIHALINQYIIASYRGELEQCLNCLQLLATTMSPKVDTAKEEGMIDNIELGLAKIMVRDTDGSIVRYNPTALTQIKIWTRRVYKMLLMKLDARGMLTFSPKDYKSILGDFSKA